MKINGTVVIEEDDMSGPRNLLIEAIRLDASDGVRPSDKEALISDLKRNIEIIAQKAYDIGAGVRDA